MCGTLSQRSLKDGDFSICLERSLRYLKATLGWAFLRRTAPELSDLSPQTGEGKVIATTLVAHPTTVPFFLTESRFAQVFALL